MKLTIKGMKIYFFISNKKFFLLIKKITCRQKNTGKGAQLYNSLTTHLLPLYQKPIFFSFVVFQCADLLNLLKIIMVIINIWVSKHSIYILFINNRHLKNNKKGILFNLIPIRFNRIIV